jgi:hypothetical protein
MTSNSLARAATASSSTICRAYGSMTSSSRRSALGAHGTSFASVTESPLANSVTSWPCRTSSSVRYETTRSVPP